MNFSFQFNPCVNKNYFRKEITTGDFSITWFVAIVMRAGSILNVVVAKNGVKTKVGMQRNCNKFHIGRKLARAVASDEVVAICDISTDLRGRCA
jgi:hypothetical protein